VSRRIANRMRVPDSYHGGSSAHTAWCKLARP
jgi:hypothetical protein